MTSQKKRNPWLLECGWQWRPRFKFMRYFYDYWHLSLEVGFLWFDWADPNQYSED